MLDYFTKLKSKVLFCAATFLIFGLFSSASHALPITFTTDPGNSTAQFVNTSGFCIGPGCTPLVVINPTPVTFDLNAIGDSFDITDFLTVSINGPSLSLGGEGMLEADIAFIAPSNAISSVASATGTFTSFFIVRDGEVTWDTQPANLLFDDGTEVSLAFSGGSDSCFGRDCQNGLSVGVDATTTLQAVPEPGVLALVGAGLLGFGAFRRLGASSS